MAVDAAHADLFVTKSLGLEHVGDAILVHPDLVAVT